MCVFGTPRVTAVAMPLRFAMLTKPKLLTAHVVSTPFCSSQQVVAIVLVVVYVKTQEKNKGIKRNTISPEVKDDKPTAWTKQQSEI